PTPMENPYKEPLKKCVLCEKRVDYKNVQVSNFNYLFSGFMPVTYKDPAYLKDPKVCNIRYRE
ncbi:hypothetical protein A6R68_18527, partial [Neotoma lepida]